MAKSKKTEVKEKNLESLKNDLKSKRDELFKAKMDLSKRSLKNTSSLTLMRKNIARILTAINIKNAVVENSGELKGEVR